MDKKRIDGRKKRAQGTKIVKNVGIDDAQDDDRTKEREGGVM